MKTFVVVQFCVLNLGLSVSVSAQAPGSMLWKFQAEPMPPDEWSGPRPAYIFSSPAVGGDGTIMFGAANGRFYCLNPNGSLKWRYTTGAEVQSSPALADDGTAYFGSVDGKLYALNPDGTLRWTFPTGEILSSPAIAKDGVIYIGSRDNYLYAVNPDGTEQWRFPTGRYVDSAPVIGMDGTIYIGSFDWQLYALNPDGTEKWRFTYGSGPAGGLGVAVSLGADGTVYACTAGEDNALYALRPEDGSEVWRFAFGPEMALVHPTVPVIGPDGTLYLGTPDRKFYAINPDGSKAWELDTGTAGHSTAAVGEDGLIYVNTWDLKTLALNPNGTVAWEYAMSGPAVGGLFTAIPTLTADGVLYVGSGNGFLYAIQGSSGFANSPWPMFNRNPRHTANAAGGLVRAPQLKIVRQDSPSELKLSLLGDVGARFDLEYTTRFEAWQKLATLTATGGWTEWDVTPPPVDASFFRVVYPAASESR